MGKRLWASTMVAGMAAVAAGLFFIFSPAHTLTVLVAVFGAFAFVAGLFTLVGGLRDRESKGHGIQSLEGALGLAAGLVLLTRPAVGGRLLLVVVAAWAIVVGVTELVQGVLARRVEPAAWMLGATGAFTFVFGIALLLGRSTGVLAISWLLGIYLVAWGCVRAAYGASMRSAAGGRRQVA